MVNFLASKIRNLYKVKLMKLLRLDLYQERLELKEIQYDLHLINGNESYHFLTDEDYKIKNLSDEEIEIIDEVINKYGKLPTQTLIDKMHDEVTYKCTNDFCIIDYSHSQEIET